MAYKDSDYQAVRFATPGSDQALQIGVLAYASSQLVTITGVSQSATALPAGCYLARIANLGANAVHIRGDDIAATTAAPALPAGQVETFVVTATTRVIRLLGTNADTVTITPYRTATLAVADDA